MTSSRSFLWCLGLIQLASCVGPPVWQEGDGAAVVAASAAGVDTVVYFALPGRELSDRMEAVSLGAPEVLATLAAGGFRSLRLDGFVEQARYTQWIGGGEGMGLCVLDPEGRVLAARPGPQDPPELSAWLGLVVERRAAVAQARQRLVAAPLDPSANYALGMLLLELGCRVGTVELLSAAAAGGVADASHRLARLFALDGRLVPARRWLAASAPSPARSVTEGYVLFKERRHAAAVAVLEAVLGDHNGAGEGTLAPDDERRARLYLAKSLHEVGRESEAVGMLEALIVEAAGTTYAGAALHTLNHLRNPDHGHTH